MESQKWTYVGCLNISFLTTRVFELVAWEWIPVNQVVLVI